MPFITINNRTLHYLDVGKGPALLLGHAYLVDHAVWREQIAVLSEKFRCIVPDLWGHGLSSATPDTNISIRSLSEDYWVLMQALDIKEYSVLGLAVGGVWAVQMALDYPDSVNALVLINPGVVDGDANSRHYYTELLNTVEQHQYIPNDVVEKLIPLFFSQHVQKEREELTQEFKSNLFAIEGPKLSTLVNMGRNILDFCEIQGVESLQVPTLILAGESARICSPQLSKAYSEKIAGADLRMIPKAGHMPCVEQPEVVNTHLQEFFGKLYPGSVSPLF